MANNRSNGCCVPSKQAVWSGRILRRECHGQVRKASGFIMPQSLNFASASSKMPLLETASLWCCRQSEVQIQLQTSKSGPSEQAR